MAKVATFTERINQIMEEKEIKQSDLVRMTGIDKGAISNYCRGKYEAKQSALMALSSALGVSETWLMGYSVPRNQSYTTDIDSYTIPVVGTIACGTPILAEQNITEYLSVPAYIHADYILRCKGDSMIGARIFDGDYVYIRKQPTVEDGQIAAVRIDDEATLKRVYHLSDGRIELRAENPMYRPIIVSDGAEAVIEGLAVWFTSEVR